MGQQGFPILAAALADPSPRRVIEKISRHVCVAGAPTPPRAQTNKYGTPLSAWKQEMRLAISPDDD
jgi:hypothetical protein